MGKWTDNKPTYTAGRSHDHEFDYGEFYMAYVAAKQQRLDRQRSQVQKVSENIKKDQRKQSKTDEV